MVFGDFRGRGDLTPRVLRHGSRPAVRFGHAGVPRAAAYSLPSWRRDLSSSFIIAACISLIFAVVVIFGNLRQSGLPQILSFTEDILISGTTPSDKESFLLRMSTQQRREIAAQVHYISNVIKSSAPKIQDARGLAFTIVSESMRAEVDPFFVTSVIKSESTFNRNARSYAGAIGLMQLMPDTARFIAKRDGIPWRGLNQLRDPSYNIVLGTAYLKYLHKMFDGNQRLMLVAYNWGPANVNDALKNRSRLLESSVKYARGIISNQSTWAQEYGQRVPEFQYISLKTAE